MTAAPSLSWPGSRVLAGWWPTLGRWRPRSLWLHHLLLHRVEALVSVSRSPPLERLNRLLLEALALSPRQPAALADLLGLDVPFLTRLLAELEAAGLARADAGGEWAPTDPGRQLLAGPTDACTVQERRTFWFAAGDRLHPEPRFLALDHPVVSHGPEPGGAFDVRVLHECLARPGEWKQQHGFPADVRGLVEAPAQPGWQHIVLVRPEQMTVLFVLAGDEQILGFAVQPNWSMQADRPVVTLREGWRESLPELVEPDLEEWRQVWRAWGQPRALPAGEMEACHLERVGTLLRVRAPRPLLERLRAARSDALKGEAWLLASAGDPTRAAALIELHDSSPE